MDKKEKEKLREEYIVKRINQMLDANVNIDFVDGYLLGAVASDAIEADNYGMLQAKINKIKLKKVI
jgi:hypothetical protein